MKAIALFSGGLDSMLAVKTVSAQGIEVVPVYFVMPFLKHTEACHINPWLQENSRILGIQIKSKDISELFLSSVKNPKYGYGKNYNPCIDCKIIMLKVAREMAEESGAGFVITGEVVGQRPKSQNRDTLNLIEKESGLRGYLLRPLSAKLLNPTIPEERNWVSREKLYDFSGRNRKPQIALAQSLGIKDYSQPAGGCLLTNESFCGKVKDCLEHNQFTLDNAVLLKFGRHLRLSDSFKLIVGRNEEENGKITARAGSDDLHFEPASLPGPSALGRGIFDENIKNTCARIVARYVKPRARDVEITIATKGVKETIRVDSMEEEDVKKFII